MSPKTEKRKETATVPRPRGPAKAESKAIAEEVHAEEKEAKGLRLPVVHTTVRPPSIGLPNVNSVPGRVLWFGGLGTLAVVGALDWPVAVAIAAGTWVAEQRAKERLRQEQESRQGER
jgi:hypothetical protein